MRAHEFIIERKKQRKKKPRWAAYGPGPYGGYGFATGYSGAVGGGDGGAVGEAVVNELNINQTLKFIQNAHGDQLYGKLPYWTHPRAVALTGKKIFSSRFNSDAVKTAFLHDVVEDTHIGLDELKKLDFSDEVIEAVGLLTKDKTLSYSDNIKKIIGSGNKLAQMVKYADNYENFSGDKSDWDPEKASASQKKYLASLNMLGDHLGVKYHVGVDEGWKDWVGGAALGATVAAGGLGAYDGYKHTQQNKEPERISVSGKVDDKSNFEKGIIRIAKDAVPKKSVTDSPHEKLLTKTAVAAGIKGEELAQFLAQTAHETMNFQHMIEIGGSLDFRKYEPKFVKDKSGKFVNVNPKAKTLGNVKKGDGARYKGRGYIQLTGRYNYKRAGQALGLPLEAQPELVEKPEVAAKVAVWFWQSRVQPRVDDFYDTRAATKPINPGLKGLEDRKEKFKDFKSVMK
jgi:putative chitinase